MEARFGMSQCENQVLQPPHHTGYNFISMSKGKQVIEDGDGYGGRRHEWDANDWEWDSRLFTAKSLHISSVETSNTNGNGIGNMITNNASEKRRKVLMGEEEEMAECLTLKLGGNDYCSSSMAVNEASGSGKRPRATPVPSSHSSPKCQVDDCKVDLNTAKDYHRRHKVCEMHAKANKALVGRLMQRFCQQCSRFHLLEEFDEGKRSCRRRLAGHNRRRRKSHPDAIFAGACLNDEHSSTSLIMTLLRVLSQLQTSNNSEQTSNQDLVVQLLKKLANSADIHDGTNAAAKKQSTVNQCSNLFTCNPTSENGNLYGSVKPQDVRSSMLNSPTITSSSRLGGVDPQPTICQLDKISTIRGSEQPFASTHVPYNVSLHQNSSHTTAKSAVPQYSNTSQETRNGLQHAWLQPNEQRGPNVSNVIDLNSVDYTSEESLAALNGPSTLMLLGGIDSRSNQSALCHSGAVSDINLTNQHQISDNAESGSDQSPSSSQVDGQYRTGRIVFKLFGKDPSEIPQLLRSQILDWLANSPSDIESYIRPGCVILTIYLRLSESVWEELGTGFKNSLERLLSRSDGGFWKTGWIFAQTGHRIAFIYNGQVVFDAPTDFGNAPQILSITPIAIASDIKASFVVKGLNLCSSNSKIICAFEGKYSVQESSIGYVQEDCDPDVHHTDQLKECTQIQYQRFTWVPPNLSGRCFIEVEGHDLRGSFFPVIVAEHDICTEIRTLERYIEIPSKVDQHEATENCGLQVKEKMEAIEFLHELGWLFQRSRLIHESNLSVLPTTFSPIRFKWLLEYATEQDLCAVVKKILNILFNNYVKCADSSAISIVGEAGILHRAVRRNCQEMVEFLLAYVPDCMTENTIGTRAHGAEKLHSSNSFILKPDMSGPAGLTPLHIAASMKSAEGVLDALTNDPCQIGAKAWTSVRDQTGRTPEEYALLGGRHSYIELVHKKLEKRGTPTHVSIDINKLIPNEQNVLNKQNCGSSSASLEVSRGKDEVKGNKADIVLSQKFGQSVSHCSDDGKIKRLPSYCKLCAQQQPNKRRANNLLYRPALLSMVAIATVCLCVTLLLKGPPQVLFVQRPFNWESMKFGPR
ncbi:hypothetical protein SUGI_0835510 [Cryptomeria japonica]|uniref:squamosa promoter-binding-like protein 1 n=1 Tax=Cryptomeria japonica TaxID=3369 RepID=UPI0024148F45|nr:squamosa promoter-binding-like protein 1 [Cryptomeria japonica]GLJ40513.1 hypothetical protein SUGI_0835510 [Cryptomeria japonica]